MRWLATGHRADDAKNEDAAQNRSTDLAASPQQCVVGSAIRADDYLLSDRGDSSIAQGQKFCGLRVADAFLTTVIFMSLLRFR